MSVISIKKNLKMVMILNEHIKYVYDKAFVLARKYDADMEIVSLGTFFMI